ncbi:MAG TPA: hypothetical protein VG871_14255 [Vicinamibacterales bacterium]|nr:hypothetical protein [Vicinamibacterales bacterium]
MPCSERRRHGREEPVKHRRATAGATLTATIVHVGTHRSSVA